MRRRSFSKEFKIDICKQIEEGRATRAQIVREHEISDNLLARWIAQYRKKGDDAFDGSPWRGTPQSDAARVKELEAALGRAHLEIEFLRDVIEKKGSRRGSESR